MAASIGDLINQLHSCCKLEESDNNSYRASDIIGNIQQIIFQELPNSENEYIASQLFGGEYSSLTFLRKTVQWDEFTESKLNLLTLLISFVSNHEKKIVPYAVDIKSTCLSLYKLDRQANIKRSAVELLMEVCRHCAGTRVESELDVTNMIEKFFQELTRASKLQATVKQVVYHMLGLFAEVFPEKMIRYSERLIETYLHCLKTEMTSKTKTPEMAVISGCLRGLTCVLVNFTESVDEGSRYCQDIYKYMKMAIDPDINHKRYEMPLAGLTLFTKHAPQFGQLLLQEYQSLHHTFVYWTTFKNREMQHGGAMALEAFFKQIATLLATKGKDSKEGHATFKFFIEYFYKVIHSSSASSKEVSLALRGYGHFATPCRTFLSADNLNIMFRDVVERSEQLILRQNGSSTDDKLINLPGFLDAIASISKELDEIPQSFLEVVQRLIVCLLENIPKLHEKLHTICHNAVLRLLHYISIKEVIFEKFLSNIVYQSLLRTCSLPPPSLTDEEKPLFEGQGPQPITYKDFIRTWLSLIIQPSVKDLAIIEVSVDEIRLLQDCIFDELMRSMFNIISRLKLAPSLKQNNIEMVSIKPDPDITEDVEQQNPAASDVVIFVNVVDFIRDILSHKNLYRHFVRWVLEYSREMIQHSTRLPTVSGFYKLLAAGMRVCTSVGYFSSKSRRSSQQNDSQLSLNETAMEVDEQSTMATKQEISFRLLCKFSREVMARLKMYTEELLAACLTFVLSVPPEVSRENVVQIVSALQLALQQGISFLPLADIALDSILAWSSSVHEVVLQPYYRDILPYIDAYLKSASDEEENKEVITKKEITKLKQRKDVRVRMRKNQNAEKSHLEAVKLKCVMLLGSLGGSVNQSLVIINSEEIGKLAVAWDTEKHLRFDVPFVDLKPSIYLDIFLPRVVELATSSSYRQTKVAACELLHALVLYMLGRSVHKPTTDDPRYSMVSLYRHVFPALLRLAADIDQVCYQLFEPLLMQLIHWFTGSKVFESPDTMALLDAITDGLASQNNGPLQAICAKCIHEFLKWSIKQTPDRQLAKGYGNIKSLLKRIYAMATHPSSFKRFGAALAFNNIYMILREEAGLVSTFSLELLAVFVESLALSHSDENTLGSQEECKKALSHLQRILVVKSAMFQMDDPNRRKPRDWTDGTLITTVRWLLRQCGRPQTECRHSCMELVYALAPLSSPDIKTGSEFFETLLKEGGSVYFLQRFEGGLYADPAGKSGLLGKPTVNIGADIFSLNVAFVWFDTLLATLDCYTWIFGQNLLTPSLLLSSSTGGNNSVILRSLMHFFDRIALGDIDNCARLFKFDIGELLFSPREHDDYDRAKCTIIVRAINFLCLLFERHCKESVKIVPETLISKSSTVIAACLLCPEKIGFNMADLEIVTKLPQEMIHILQVFKKQLPERLLKSVLQSLSTYMTNNSCNLATILPIDLVDSNTDFTRLAQLVNGYEQLYTVGLLQSLSFNLQISDLGQKLLDNVSNAVVKESDGELKKVELSDTSLTAANQLLSLAFKLGVTDSVFLEKLFAQEKVAADSNSRTVIKAGQRWYSLFKKPVNNKILDSLGGCIPSIMSRCSIELNSVASILINLLEHTASTQLLRKRYGTQVVEAIGSQWHMVHCWWSNENVKVESKDIGKLVKADQESKALVVQVLTKMFIIDYKCLMRPTFVGFPHIHKMYCSLLSDRTINLAFKTKLMELLPFFLSLPENEIHQVRTSVDSLIADSFPARSTEYPLNSPKYFEYIGALDALLSALELSGHIEFLKVLMCINFQSVTVCLRAIKEHQILLSALELSGSIELLEVLMSIICKEERHVYEQKILKTLAQFTARLPRDKQKIAANVAYEIFGNAGNYTREQRRAAIEKVVMTMLMAMNKESITDFFISHIRSIMKEIDQKLSKFPEDVIANQLVSKICCFQLMEILYTQFGRDELLSKTSRINAAFCDRVDKGNELTQQITKLAHDSRKEDVRGETVLTELRRQYHCAAHRCLIAVICCTQTDPKFFKVFLFSEDIAKGQFLLDNLIDNTRVYHFPVELEAAMTQRKQLVSLRSDVKKWQTIVKNEEDGENASSSQSPQYLSQYLTDSSIAADISQFDFGTNVKEAISSSPLSGSTELGKISRQSSRFVTEEEMSGNMSIDLENDDLNAHECMLAIVTLIRSMVARQISPQIAEGTIPTEMPSWMQYLHKKLEQPDTLHNVKLFICRLVINLQDIFRPFAKFWLCPIVRFVTTGGWSDEPMNYLVIDLVTIILSWHPIAIPDDTMVDRAMASRLLEYLMINCYHSSRAVFRNNLQVIKILVEVWKSRIDIPTKAIYDYLTTVDSKIKQSTIGPQLVGVAVANGLLPYRAGSGVSKEKFYESLARQMTDTSRQLIAATAEVTGWVLKLLSEQETGKEELEWQEKYLENISSLLLGFQELKPDAFLTCVHRLSLHYPPIVKRFMPRVLYLLPKLHGDFKRLSLEIILSQASSYEGLFIELKNRGFADILARSDDELQQLAALKLTLALSSRLSAAENLFLFPTVCNVLTSHSIQCRGVVYDIAKEIKLKWKDNLDTDDEKRLHEQAVNCLIRGLTDSDEKLRLTVTNFWTSESQLPSSTIERSVTLLEKLYLTSEERDYLSYATCLLLERTSHSPDYNRVMFEQPLSDCDFKELQLASSWRQRHATMRPLFAMTQQSLGGMETQPPTSHVGRKVKATQQVHDFTASLDPGHSKGPYNWLTQSSFDTYANIGGGTMPLSSIDIASSLLFTIGKSDAIKSSSAASHKSAGLSTAQQSSKRSLNVPITADETDGAEVTIDSNDILRLRKRFLKDQNSQKAYYIRRHVRLEKMRQEAKVERKERRENQVTLYRQYRTGELPDIQIKYSCIIAPLQALAQLDVVISRHLFSSLFKAVLNKLEEAKLAREVTEILAKVSSSIGNMLKSSTSYFRPFIAALMDILMEFPQKISIEPDYIASACLMSLQPSLGIILLDETLIHMEKSDTLTGPVSKRAKSGKSLQSANQANLWIAFSRLYGSLRDQDVLQAIFSHFIDTLSLTRDALSAEMRGDLPEAIKLYTEGLTCTAQHSDHEPSKAEIDLWTDCRLQCLAQLTEWEKLADCVTDAIDERTRVNLDRLWDNNHKQEHYLGPLLKSRIKMLLCETCTNEDREMVLDFVRKAMSSEDSREIMENRFSNELALLSTWEQDYGRAKYFVQLSCENFLNEWHSLDTLLINSRMEQLQCLQKLSEMSEFLDFVTEERNFDTKRPSELLIEKWMKRSPHVLLESSNVWDDVISNRLLFISHLINKLSASNVSDVDEMISNKVKLQLSYAQATCEQTNYAVALKQLKSSCKTAKNSSDSELIIKWTHVYAHTHLSKCYFFPSSPELSINSTIGVLKHLGKLDMSSSRPQLCVKQSQLYGRSMELLMEGLQDDLAITTEIKQKLATFGFSGQSNEQLRKEILEKAFTSYKEAVSISENSLSYNSHYQQHNYLLDDEKDAYMTLALFSDNQLRNVDEGKIALSTDQQAQFATAAVTCLLEALKNGSVSARQLFPRLLQVMEAYPSVSDNFIKHMKEVPSWMVLDWVNQLTALIDKPVSRALQDLLLTLVRDYPQAMVYPFRMSDEGYVFENSADGRAQKMFRDKLHDLLSKNSLVDKFIAALDQFSQPTALFRDWTDDSEILRLMKDAKANEDRLKTLYQQMYHNLFSYLTDSQHSLFGTQEADDYSKLMGPFRLNFAKKYRSKIDKHFGNDGNKLLSMSHKKFEEVAKELNEEMANDAKSTPPPQVLKEYSNWLNKFQAADQVYDLEIPGQYSSAQKPIIEHHVKVSSFDETVLVLSSIRKPKRITIRGSDEREYKFLVKGGEDLRQDQRIEQLFSIMNNVMQRDSKCCHRQIVIRTYKVVPMTPRLGLIEWMEKTEPLKEFLREAMTKQEKDLILSDRGPVADHQKSFGYNPKTYYEAYKKLSRSDVTTAFRRRENMIPADLARRAYQRMSLSAEAFFTLRNNFAISHSQMSICHWILGIGDRHLSNFMIDLETGKIVGIDFGHAFGSATQFLPIPELMPFRLTRQLRNIMLPMQEKGLMDGVMIHTLSAMRRNIHILLSTMDIFIKEPSLDWKQNAERQMRAMTSYRLDMEDLQTDHQWFPRQKVLLSKRKLTGWNPTHIAKEELETGHKGKKFHSDFEKVLLGDREIDVRAQLPVCGLNVKQQVDCLINQATDPNILGRVWAGWEPWM